MKTKIFQSSIDLRIISLTQKSEIISDAGFTNGPCAAHMSCLVLYCVSFYSVLCCIIGRGTGLMDRSFWRDLNNTMSCEEHLWYNWF